MVLINNADNVLHILRNLLQIKIKQIFMLDFKNIMPLTFIWLKLVNKAYFLKKKKIQKFFRSVCFAFKIKCR